MVFSSTLFLAYFFPLFLLTYLLTPNKLRNFTLLAASILFYAWGAPDFIFIVLASIVADFYIVRAIPRYTGKKRKLLAGASILLNISLLAYFKYANFLVDNLNILLQFLGSGALAWTSIALPIGISFFTFQKITYTVDVYRNVHAPLTRVTDYAMYILMFPQLIAGPIVRYNEIADQITDRKENETNSNRFSGFFRFVIGLSKKVLIANVLGQEADRIFALDPGLMGSSVAWTGVIAYAFQIYYDFSGYSDMAIGLGLMTGFRFPENFNNPYISRNITEFWRRWHITLGRFMKDYLYIPLGGNRVGTARMFFNLWLVFVISGLWHGAAWNFVVWGVYHGAFLIMDRLFLLRFTRAIGKVPSIVLTFFVTLIGWVFFRADSLTHATAYLKSMFAFEAGTASMPEGIKFYWLLGLGAFFAFFAIFKGVEKWQEKVLAPVSSIPALAFRLSFSLFFFVLALATVTATGFNPFIYFRF